ncbi:murein L,D-transpeptidase catalytic domain family protein [Lunatibacter salilacus]|uniref:murein L,D-transpeptidase catalytic domain family protein n=1 Tax=Lunatibacter salilacus TaxID=2483804 RepID=UPI00131EAD60|nr:murein L,D-transpeptidase catalytic domain family protein [Lunatibacter salilacus]
MKRIWCIIILSLFGPLLSPKIHSSSEERFSNASILPKYAEDINYLTELIFDEFDESKPSPQKSMLEKALTGYFNLIEQGAIATGRPLTIIDFSMPSTDDRLWVIDMEKMKIHFQSLVAHGRNSGENLAKNFSNQHSSYMSSVGFYLTGETYQGNHGYSLRLDGLEKGFNDQARSRAIVIHGADYVDEKFISTTGRLGRSLGCPALPMDTHEEIINVIKEKSPLFIYAEVPEYLAKSPLLKPLG